MTTPLSTQPNTKVEICHALVVRLGPCSIVVPFSPAQGGALDENCLVNPIGGEYQIFPHIRRWEIMPSGLFQVFALFAHTTERQHQQIISGMKTTKKDSKKLDEFVDSLNFITKLSQTLQQPIDAISLRLLPPKEEELIRCFLSKSQSVLVRMLPEGFDIRSPPPQVILKKGYMLVYHIHNEEDNATFFLAANGKLVVIIVCRGW